MTTENTSEADPIAKGRMAFVDGVLGAAGHRIEDSEVRDILHRQITAEIDGDQAREEIRAYQGLAG